MEPELLTTSEAAQLAHMSRAWLYTGPIATGEIPVLHLGSKTVRIRRRDLMAWIDGLCTREQEAAATRPLARSAVLIAGDRNAAIDGGSTAAMEDQRRASANPRNT